MTDFVKTQLAGDKIVSLFIKDPKNTDIMLAFNSRENVNNLPQLVISTGEQNKLSINKPGITSDGSAAGLGKTLFSRKASGALKTSVYPNPVHTKFTLQLAGDIKGSYELQVTDVLGKAYKIGRYESVPGINMREIDISKLSLKAGVYFLRIQYTSLKAEVIKMVAE